MPFKFVLKQSVVITVSGETGQVVSRLDTINAEHSYLVSYKAANGCSDKKWFDSFELAEVPAQ
ncbi:hypothetical protein [Yersinia massiliensis]|uniref:hypothetical protein n=1 Tax=Yersinia massiliensis TaxID=419257 RepID=UPI000C15E399|nr:hypothetical protein [Yersinia massiliensis]PHZ22648.1 hypothetical protein CS535_16070 [Yersinia massiliensis]